METIERGDVKRKNSYKMEKGLELLAISAKLKAKSVLKSNDREAESSCEKNWDAYYAFEQALDKRAKDLLRKHEVVEPIQKLAEILAECDDMHPLEVFGDIRYYHADYAPIKSSIRPWDQKLYFIAKAQTIIDFNHLRNSGCKTATFSGNEVEVVVEVGEDSSPELFSLYKAWCIAHCKHMDAQGALEAAKEDLGAVEEWSDLAKVKLTRMELQDLGPDGDEVLGVIDRLLDEPDVDLETYLTVSRSDGKEVG